MGNGRLATFAEAGHFYSAAHQLPALIIPTWNDYEEGTAPAVRNSYRSARDMGASVQPTPFQPAVCVQCNSSIRFSPGGRTTSSTTPLS